jgi:hypothetical protein
MNADPIAKLAKFTPASAADPAELLFAAGRASARTHWGWKAAVAGLLLTNSVAVALFALRLPAPALQPEPQPATPAVTPRPEPPQSAPPTGTVTTEPWSYQVLASAGDPERFPKTEPTRGGYATPAPLTPLSARRGEID